MRVATLAIAAALATLPSAVHPEQGGSELNDSRGVASSILRAHLRSNDAQDRADHRVRLELAAAHGLLRRVLVDATEDGDSGALQILRAECQRLRPEVDARAASDGSRSSEWSRVRAALEEVCGLAAQLVGTPSPQRRSDLASPMLKRMHRAGGDGLLRAPPTVHLPKRRRSESR